MTLIYITLSGNIVGGKRCRNLRSMVLRLQKMALPAVHLVIDGSDDTGDNSPAVLKAVDIYSLLEALCDSLRLGRLCVWWCGLTIDYLRVHLSFEICKSNAFVDRDVSKQKHSILKIKTIIVRPIKLGAIS